MHVFLNAIDDSSTLGCWEQLTKIGHYLKTIRTGQGLSLQQVAKRTHIQPNQLQAIETGNHTQLPEAIYVKGFLKRYAQVLGLNGTAIADMFAVEPTDFNPRWLNRADFSVRSHGHGTSGMRRWSRLIPLG